MDICQVCDEPRGEITAEDILKWLLKLPSDEARMDAINVVTEHICIHCGSTYLPCMCQRDD